MISLRVLKYIDDHSFCSEYLFKDWETFLDFIYEEGGRVSSILWWEHCKKNFQHGYGGYSDPDDGEWMYSETWFHEDGFEEKSLADIKAYIHDTREHGQRGSLYDHRTRDKDHQPRRSENCDGVETVCTVYSFCNAVLFSVRDGCESG
ncbi:MAG: hypothetical protein IJK56_02590 [Firmicutes bacterium]|nr:hypothetical protein [Bacillota bacterium]